MKPQVTVLTDPIPYNLYRWKLYFKNMARGVRNIIRPFPTYINLKYGCHHSVTRSLVEGLQKIGVSVAYNPRKLSGLGSLVVIPCGVSALKQMIMLKRAGIIEKLVAGPNMADFPSEYGRIMCSEDINSIIVPSDWFRNNFISDCPELEARVTVWPAGVDTELWKPEKDKVLNKQVLVYVKPNKGLPIPVEAFLPLIVERGYEVKVVKYGEYTPEQYLKYLRESRVMVGFSTDESQGLAWAEAWSVNVTTLLWNQSQVTYKARTYNTSSSPYLSKNTGLFFTNVSEFNDAFGQWEVNSTTFSPREWIIRNMSDEVCAQRLYNLLLSV